MQIKNEKQTISYFNMFDVMDSGKKETNVAKFLAYIISKNAFALKSIINLITGADDILKNKNSKKILKNTSIEIEHTYNDKELCMKNEAGRTDIEIRIFNDHNKIETFIIIECKVHDNKASVEQFEKYRNVFELPGVKNATNKYFVYLSNQTGVNLLHSENIKHVDLNWREVINQLYNCQDQETEHQQELIDFINYYERSYGMSNQKEILIQDLGRSEEIERFYNCVYRRDKVNGSPLYFAPYFTRNKSQNEGINYISKILGIITTEKILWENARKNCENFIEMQYPCKKINNLRISKIVDVKTIENEMRKINSSLKIKNLKGQKEKNSARNKMGYRDYQEQLNYIDNKKKKESLLRKWEKAIVNSEIGGGKNNTYYFLDDPIQLKVALKKDTGNEVGRGKNWIAAAIPKNRCINFSDFLEHSMLVEQGN